MTNYLLPLLVYCLYSTPTLHYPRYVHHTVRCMICTIHTCVGVCGCVSSYTVVELGYISLGECYNYNKANYLTYDRAEVGLHGVYYGVYIILYYIGMHYIYNTAY